MKQTKYSSLIAAAMVVTAAGNTQAQLAGDSTLQFGTGSSVALEASPGYWMAVSINAGDGLLLGTVQPENIDSGFHLFSQPGAHRSSAAVSVINAEGNAAELDFGGWMLEWSGTLVDLGGGIATLQCNSDCSAGDSYTLNYETRIPASVDMIGGLPYRLTLQGVVE